MTLMLDSLADDQIQFRFFAFFRNSCFGLKTSAIGIFPIKDYLNILSRY